MWCAYRAGVLGRQQAVVEWCTCVWGERCERQKAGQLEMPQQLSQHGLGIISRYWVGNLLTSKYHHITCRQRWIYHKANKTKASRTLVFMCPFQGLVLNSVFIILHSFFKESLQKTKENLEEGFRIYQTWVCPNLNINLNSCLFFFFIKQGFSETLRY